MHTFSQGIFFFCDKSKLLVTNFLSHEMSYFLVVSLHSYPASMLLILSFNPDNLIRMGTII